MSALYLSREKNVHDFYAPILSLVKKNIQLYVIMLCLPTWVIKFTGCTTLVILSFFSRTHNVTVLTVAYKLTTLQISVLHRVR